ncbi:LTA synthase family protein [Anaerobacillus sp. MEB173]|uniref:LTA synthase family protein n=1 Tax=Anaerobacillus sp. MEB173 TaxID=3383345 RepID=UPI003F90D8C4
MNAFVNNNRMLLFCIVLLWLKTFIISSITFQINIPAFVETLIFAINPLGFLILIFSIGLLFKTSFQPKYFLVVSLLLSIVLYSNVVYYREFNDFITLPMLLMSSNAGDLSTSVLALIKWYDILYFIDVLYIAYIALKKIDLFTVSQFTFRPSKGAKIAIMIPVVFTLIAFVQVKSLDEAHSFNRDQLVKALGVYNFYIYDALLHTQINTQTAFSDETDWSKINKHLAKHRVSANEELFGIAKDMNVVVISVESLENFVIGETLHGKEITPYLNELIENSFYFENFYYQTGQGKTSDAEFIINNSLYPLGRGAVFLTHFENEYRALPETLRNHGYSTSVFHANDKTFYNRDIMYPVLGYDQFYSFDNYDISIENSVGWGMKDIEFFRQSVNHLTSIPQPFYSTFITLTNHFPYDLDEEDHYIDQYDSESPVVNQYFPTVRYTDEALRVFINQLKQQGLYENTMFVIYGDHYGIAPGHHKELSKYLGKEIDLSESVKLKRVPLIIHIPGLEGKTFDTVAGQIDVMPTLLNLLGIPEGNHIMFGNDLFAKGRQDFAVLRDGTVITKDLIYTNDMCLNYETGLEVSIKKCEPLKEKGLLELSYSDKIIYGDLFRFQN